MGWNIWKIHRDIRCYKEHGEDIEYVYNSYYKSILDRHTFDCIWEDC